MVEASGFAAFGHVRGARATAFEAAVERLSGRKTERSGRLARSPGVWTPADSPVAARSLTELFGRPGAVALFLDFDGVVAELAPTPESAEVKPQMIARLQSAGSALGGALAIVSGRDIAGLDALLAPLVLAVAGDHGNVRRRSDGQTVVLNAAATRAAGELYGVLAARFAGDSRIIVERKASAVAVHYRLAPERADECIAAVREAAAAEPELMPGTGKMVAEARARGATKGAAVHGFMGEAPFAGRTPVFVGDDLTDEDGFVAAQELGGAGIKVGDGDTVALFRIGSAAEVPGLLDTVVRMQRWAS
jgi:trehalose 6-phosphate phosphatase